jgi:GH15 family glucan-1,4-alpha-glucosidase
MTFLPLQNYGVIGRGNQTALVNRYGALEWCCFPHIDSPSHLGLGGRFQLMPHGEFHSEQHYLQRTQVLETAFETPFGRAILTDWMPLEEAFDIPMIYRKIAVTQGRVPFLLHCAPRFDYGRDPGSAEHQNGDVVFRGHGDQVARLSASIPLEITGERGERNVRSSFTLETGESAVFRWSWGFSRPRLLTELSDVNERSTVHAWREWAHHCEPVDCPFAGPWHDAVTRASMLTRLLTQPETGAIAESIIPSESSDHRYAWIRDGAWSLQALANLGYPEECKKWFQWLTDLLERDGTESIQSVYGLDGGPTAAQENIGGITVGSAATSVFQLSTYGHILLAASEYFQLFGNLPEGLWSKLSKIADLAGQSWRRPDYGFWGAAEPHSKPEHFVSSKLFCWVALDRAIALGQALHQSVPARWSQEREILHRTICSQGFDPSLGSFLRSFGSRSLDTATLLMPILGFLPIHDPRIAGTLAAIQTELSDGVLLRKHSSDEEEASFSKEAAHLLSSLWMIDCLAIAGRANEASDGLAEICSYSTPLGIFGEYVNPKTGESWGSFPSGPAHLGLLNAALYVGAARGRRTPTGHLMGMTQDATCVQEGAERKRAS